MQVFKSIILCLCIATVAFGDSPWLTYMGKEYFVSTGVRSWNVSHEICTNMSADLASFGDIAEFEFITNYIKAYYNTGYWIGLVSSSPTGACKDNTLWLNCYGDDRTSNCCQERLNWTWIDGTAMDFMKWFFHSPFHPYPCARLHHSNITSWIYLKDFFWSAQYCYASHRFICERYPLSTSSAISTTTVATTADNPSPTTVYSSPSSSFAATTSSSFSTSFTTYASFDILTTSSMSMSSNTSTVYTSPSSPFPIMTTSSSSTSHTIAIAAGVSVAACLLLAAVILVGVFLIRRRKKKAFTDTHVTSVTVKLDTSTELEQVSKINVTEYAKLDTSKSMNYLTNIRENNNTSITHMADNSYENWGHVDEYCTIETSQQRDSQSQGEYVEVEYKTPIKPHSYDKPYAGLIFDTPLDNHQYETCKRKYDDSGPYSTVDFSADETTKME